MNFDNILGCGKLVNKSMKVYFRLISAITKKIAPKMSFWPF